MIEVPAGNRRTAKVAPLRRWVTVAMPSELGRKALLIVALAASGLLTTGCAITDPRLPSRQVIERSLAAHGLTRSRSTESDPGPEVVSFRWRKVKRLRYLGVDLLCDVKDDSKVLAVRTRFTLYDQSDETRAHYKRFRQFVLDLTEMDADRIPMRSYGWPSLITRKEKGAVRRNGLRLEEYIVYLWADGCRYELILCDDRL